MTGGFPMTIENMGYFARFPVGFQWISCFFLRLYCDILLWGGILEGPKGELRMEKREDPFFYFVPTCPFFIGGQNSQPFCHYSLSLIEIKLTLIDHRCLGF